MDAEKIKELRDFHAAAIRCREVPYRTPEAVAAYQAQFDRVLDVLLPALLDEVEALRADAERYRWLRDPPIMHPLQVWIACPNQSPAHTVGPDWLAGESADTAIDAAMKETP